MDTRSTEYVEWMAYVWKANDKRNRRMEEEKRLASQNRELLLEHA